MKEKLQEAQKTLFLSLPAEYGSNHPVNTKGKYAVNRPASFTLYTNVNLKVTGSWNNVTFM